MKLVIPFDGSSGPDCIVEHTMNGFRFDQANQGFGVTPDQALAIAGFLEELEAVVLATEGGDLVPPGSEVPGLEVAIEPANSEWAHAVRLTGADGSVAFDLDAIWAVRVFMREAVRQETEGLYQGW